jgi:hypothetical protein
MIKPWNIFRRSKRDEVVGLNQAGDQQIEKQLCSPALLKAIATRLMTDDDAELKLEKVISTDAAGSVGIQGQAHSIQAGIQKSGKQLETMTVSYKGSRKRN